MHNLTRCVKLRLNPHVHTKYGTFHSKWKVHIIFLQLFCNSPLFASIHQWDLKVHSAKSLRTLVKTHLDIRQR